MNGPLTYHATEAPTPQLTSPRPDESEPFSIRLKQGTREVHSMAENTAFIQGFLRGVISPHHYVRLLADLRLVYQAMESALVAQSAHPLLAPFARPEIYRVSALDRDLAYFQNRFGVEAPAPSVAAHQYAERLAQLGRHDPALLIAHSYTRYLGDLSGGQILGKTVRRALDLPAEEGTAFYHFPGIASLAGYKLRYKQALDALPLSEAQIQAQVQEAVRAFRLNIAIFESLEGNPWPVLFRTAWRSIWAKN